MYAVVRTGGKQYRVQEGRGVTVERLPGEAGDTVELQDVLLMAEGDAVTVGTPTIPGARVVGTITEQGRGDKVIVFRYKAKTRSRKKTGHRQQYTRLLVENILAAGQEPMPKKTEAPATAEAVSKPKARRRRKAEAQPAAEAAPETPTATTPAETEQPAPKPRRTRKKAE